MKMLLNSTALMIFLLAQFYKDVAAAEDYFERSIFRALKKRGGQFTSEVEFYRHNWLSHVDGQKEILDSILLDKYSFKSNIGEHTDRPTMYRRDSKVKYIDSKEVYFYQDDEMYCSFRHYSSELLDEFLSYWAPYNIYTDEYEGYNTIGPSVLIEVLLENFDKNKQSVECVNGEEKAEMNSKRNCSITFDDLVRLEYNLVDKGEYKMYPETVVIHEKNETTGEWMKTKVFKFKSFTPIFDAEPIVDSSLPIGFGCVRMWPNNYPAIETNYGKRFEIEQEVSLSYKEKIGNETRRRFKIWQGNTTRNYSNKMFVDLESSINEAHTIDELTGTAIRTIYENESQLLHSVSIDDNECLTYNLTSDETLNWFYVQDMFVKRPELFHMKNHSKKNHSKKNYSTFSYIGDYNLDNVPCQVFEKWFLFFSTKSHVNLAKNEQETLGHRLNGNKISPFAYVYSTHYYPKDKNYWSDESDQLIVPKKIEIRVFDESSYKFYDMVKIAQLNIYVKSFNSNPDGYEAYDSSECTEA